MGTFDQVRDFLRAEFYSDDISSGFDPQSFKVLTPVVVGVTDRENPAALGSADFLATPELSNRRVRSARW
eukprot:4086179-Pyramimonas_sp.AAC.1